MTDKVAWQSELRGKGIHALCDCLVSFANHHGMKLESADEMLLRILAINPADRTPADLVRIAWLQSFIKAWEEAADSRLNAIYGAERIQPMTFAQWLKTCKEYGPDDSDIPQHIRDMECEFIRAFDFAAAYFFEVSEGKFWTLVGIEEFESESFHAVAAWLWENWAKDELNDEGSEE